MKTVCLYSPNGHVQVYENATQVGVTSQGRIAFVNQSGEHIDSNLQYKVITKQEKTNEL